MTIFTGREKKQMVIVRVTTFQFSKNRTVGDADLGGWGLIGVGWVCGWFEGGYIIFKLKICHFHT